ncbi:Hypothetical predicted protein [Lecanosticta acicola]|uniref:T6SS Phospholipase effector Tle1-like catalytic domain-containing protein n=1 Tax=Lecanosticta acicola TaxID=111012 RepID=A0AAI8Z011_9PEZI|nr:Hypothetical predicted protein [Lecanosticta acicola]
MANNAGTPAPLPGYRPKKLIVCCDGTWRNSDSGIFSNTVISWIWRGREQVPTNVTRISRAIETTDSQGKQQVVYYQAGIGSEGNLIQRLLAGALGIGLAANIQEAYAFIAKNYVTGDEIYLIGFSRGAFTARSIGALIGDLGLLTVDGLDKLVDIVEDWEHAGSASYRTLISKDEPSFAVKNGSRDPKAYVSQYRAELTRFGYTRKETIPIKAIGVWETVGSLGVPVNPVLQRIGFPLVLRTYRFYNTELGSNVENAFHALALDEARAAYRPALWQKLPGVNANMKQTWFPGVHTDVGGGYANSGLSDITLAWMMSNLAPFIDFTPGYIRKQWVKNQAYLRKEKVPETGFKWAAGQIKNATSGLRRLLGIVWRTPGRYHVLNMKTLTVREGDPLQNTHERIHTAVRSREITGGLDDKNHVTSYQPKALERSKYELLDSSAEPGLGKWRYVGNEKPFTGEILPEDQLGPLEMEIFEDFLPDQPTRCPST